jgi:hypothetical protein
MSLLSKTLLLVMALGAVPAALAERSDRPPQGAFEVPRREHRVAQQDGPTLGDAVEMVRRRYPGGRIVSAETRMSGNREVHIIKVLTQDGKMITEQIPGRTRGG